MQRDEAVPYRLTCATSGYLVDDEGALLFHRPPVPVSLMFHPTDPLAVHLQVTFDDAPVVWVFALELVEEGLMVETGTGDVHVQPEGRFMYFTFTHEDSFFSFALPSGAVVEFLDRARTMVPPDQEGFVVSEALDAELDGLLGSGS